MTVWRLDWGAKAVPERRNQDGGNNPVQLGGDITKESRRNANQRSVEKEAYEG